MQQLKEQRMSPAEKFVLGKFKGARPSKQDEFGYVDWYKDGECLFTQSFKSTHLWVNLNICSVLRKECGIGYGEIEQLLGKLLYKYTNNGQLTIQII
jgi:hypothetical protein